MVGEGATTESLYSNPEDRPADLKEFESNLSEGLQSLGRAGAVSLGWIQQALDLVLSTRENLEPLLPEILPAKHAIESKITKAKSEVEKLMEVCNVLRKNIADIRYYQMFVHLALQSLERDGSFNKGQCKRTRLLLKNCMEALEGRDEEISRLSLQKARLETCEKLLREVESIIAEENLLGLSDGHPSQRSFLAGFYGTRITTIFILQVLSRALSMNPKQNVEELIINKEPIWANSLLDLNRMLMEQMKSRKTKGGFSFTTELADMDAHVLALHELFDEVMRKGSYQEDGWKLKQSAEELGRKSVQLDNGLAAVELQIGELSQVLAASRSAIQDVLRECRRAPEQDIQIPPYILERRSSSRKSP